MLNEQNFFWKNFRLGTELQVAGTFIYNAIYTLENMETFFYEEECFEFLYNISVGLERLQKIAIILIEHDECALQEEFEKSLITHNHLILLNRIQKKRSLNLGKIHNKFFVLLDTFYNSVRYDRYSMSSVYRQPRDQAELIKFISEELGIEIKIGLPFSTAVSTRIKKFVGKIIGKIAIDLYERIKIEANRLRTYTYEIAYKSKSFKIFIAREFDFEKEKLMQREIAVFLIKNMPDDMLNNFIKDIAPLDFGQLHTNKYFESMFNYHKDRQVLDEMEYLYEEMGIKSSRKDDILVLGSDICFDEFPIDEDYDEKKEDL